ncbi:PD-(D/E)XK nuclease family protein [Marinobacter sp. DY40_1A1]|uniref:PDDEXK-like family protein n=1 Tax=Marinobacter sp. DY40_1A1 TaxID=2583229 RepID=UPI0019039452|nr:PD-(D/E)XK nuclease family protein [Marinobacter sp. DY40_1A1]MBK1885618.1 PD-(D/E)XK nuclease family protein [Marinobacter sp. DY40_1A1]
MDSWKELFAALDRFEGDQAAQKQQGLNDFNLLSSVLSVNDEVRLHTRFIYSLLNPKGKHYQGTRFLELFLEAIGRQDWLLDFSSVTVLKEHCPDGQQDQIDLWITDGKRQIVIENKLSAQDQKRQVARYLKAVGATNPEQADDTLFIYLTKNRQSPSDFGLGDLMVCQQTRRLLNANRQPVAHYQNLSYRRHTQQNSIHAWLDSCTQAVERQSNIAWALQDYQAVVERATKEYVSKVKTLKDVLDEGIAQGKRHHEQALQLTKELPSIHASWLEQALTSKLEAFLEPLVSKGAMTRIGSENAELLNPFVHNAYQNNTASLLYTPRFNFFRPGNGTRNRGAFYRLEAGPYATQAVLMLFYGSKMLHVGCLLTETAERSLDNLLPALTLSKPTKLAKHVFPRVLTYAEPLEYQGIIHLADFSNSPQRHTLNQLLTTLDCADGTTAS